MVISERLFNAIETIRVAAREFVQRGLFVPGVLTRFEQWTKDLPKSTEDLAWEIAIMAGKRNAGTGADVNGVALDQVGKPSLESLVLHYASEDESLFPVEAVLSVKEKLRGHRGPKYLGPWP